MPTADMKTIVETRAAPGRHWVGDGFPVYNLFGYRGEGVALRSPFLLLDYAAPVHFEPNPGPRRGVGQHPHRGFETVTLVYQGEVEHRDSSGAGGVIGPGDVQWMTAGGGILHEEFHSERYSRAGGPFEIVQFWVNLPKAHKMTLPHYQSIKAAQIPVIDLPGEAGRVRVIAGRHGDGQGPAQTYSPMNVWDVRLAAGRSARLDQPEGWSALLVALAGRVRINGEAVLDQARMATLSQQGTGLVIEAHGDAKVLLLAGEPIDEPVVGHGPFVMNSQADIAQAIADFNSGRFGRMG